MADRVLICGGAGFIGSNIAIRFVEAGWRVIVVDGLLPRTHGRRANLDRILSHIELIARPLESVTDLGNVVSGCDVVVDTMGWSRHLLALEDPLYDLRLNLQSHLQLVRVFRRGQPRLAIYLGSRHQYGNQACTELTEDAALVPADIQGIHKTAADHHFRLVSQRTGVPVVSLRFGNTFGPNQPTEGDDIGLVGTFIRNLLLDQTLVVYSGGRRRNCVFVVDLAEVVFRIATRDLSGYQAFNVGGHDLTIRELVEAILAAAGRGSYRLAEMPEEVRSLEVGSARFSDGRLRALMGDLPRHDLRTALALTIAWFRASLRR
ncbi:MAG: NAD-dependent epimerase/dehydratase family protein [Candidatus Rokuibacteriota bacterium]